VTPLYNIRASIIDIRTDEPQPHDQYLVDSNVLYWLYLKVKNYTPVIRPYDYQLREYAKYVVRAAKSKATLYHSGLSFAEIAHLVENNQRREFDRTSAKPNAEKDYRHNFSEERSQVVREIQFAWRIVQNLVPQTLETRIDGADVNAALARLGNAELDGYDVYLIESVFKGGMTQVITDDGDFATVSGLTVFTSNTTLIQQAHAADRLVGR
jgi:predicted nucleic acid-binding protein